MISRAHGLVLAVLLGTASAVGAYALIATAHLGDTETKPEAVSSRQIAQRARKLDAWEASLRKTLKAKPPALPTLNRYAAVTFLAPPGAATLPTPVPGSRPAAPQARLTAKPTAKRPTKRPGAEKRPAAERPTKNVAAASKPIRGDDAPERATPVAATGPERSTPDPTPTPAPAVVAVAAAPAPAATPTPPAALSVEQQCRALLRAAENKSEQIKQEAERQCEALKQAAEKKG